MRNNNSSFLLNIANIILGLVILLFGMRAVSSISISLAASYINIIPLCLSLWYISKTLKLNQFIGKKAEKSFIIFIVLLTLFSITFSYYFVYNDYLNKNGELCAHREHVWFYDNILTISKFTLFDWVNGALADLHLGKYENLSVYGSLFLRYGGDLPTNMCIWSAFNLALVAILIVLTAAKFGIEDKKRLWFIMLICLMQPYLDMIFACHRDGYGQVTIVLGFYIFVCTYKNSLSGIIAFPFYAFLFWIFRAQYIIIAVAIFFWSTFMSNRKSLNLIFGIVVVALVVLFLLSTINIVDYAYSEMYVGGYEVVNQRAGRSIVNMILISTLGYFPWPNLLQDPLWPWQVFAVFQGAMNVAMLYHVILIYKNKLSSIIDNPDLFIGVLLLAASVFVPGHMSYTVVAMPFFASSLVNVSKKRFLKTYGISILIIFFAGLLYSSLGLSGSRAFI